MAENKVLKEDDDDQPEVAIVEVPSEKAEEAAKVNRGEVELEAKDDDAEEHEDEAEAQEDEGDARLAESQDDEEDVSPNRKRRQKRRELQRRAREKTERELAVLREQNDLMARRLAAVEGRAIANDEQVLDQRLQEALRDGQQAEQIMAKAIEAGNGEDAAAALRLRDQAYARANQLFGEKQRTEQVKKQAAQPQADPRVTALAKEWLDANPWYDPKLGDEDSRVTKAIDETLLREGFNPRSVDYWHELTRRVSRRIGGDAETGEGGKSEGKRRPPPMGKTREHAPKSTREEIWVTPERKAAMIEAGMWDDPKKRETMAKVYRDYDRKTAR